MYFNPSFEITPLGITPKKNTRHMSLFFPSSELQWYPPAIIAPSLVPLAVYHSLATCGVSQANLKSASHEQAFESLLITKLRY